MNRQRKVLITTTYNELGIIIDTKAEEVAQPDLQPTCNQLATDCISRQQAIDALDGFRCGTKAAWKVIEDLPSAQPHWIPCSERMPEKNGDYLITGRQGAVNKRRYEDGRWYGNWGVIAWRPLPKPYKEDTDD